MLFRWLFRWLFRRRFCWMNRQFSRWKREDQPSMARVHRCKPESISKEGAVGACVLAVYDYVDTRDHAFTHPISRVDCNNCTEAYREYAPPGGLQKPFAGK